jgi:hypothetical protein
MPSDLTVAGSERLRLKSVRIPPPYNQPPLTGPDISPQVLSCQCLFDRARRLA